MTPGPDDIEFRLRAFRPRGPAPLPAVFVLHRSRQPFWIAAGVGIAAAALVVLRIERSPVVPVARVERATLGPLTTLAVGNPDEFDAAMTRISRESLPDVRQAGGVFRQLARE